MGPARVVGENVLVLDGDPYVCTSNILVISDVHTVDRSRPRTICCTVVDRNMYKYG